MKGNFQIENHLNENLYYDPSHFYKSFKKFMNITPGEYRKILFRENCNNHAKTNRELNVVYKLHFPADCKRLMQDFL